MKIIVVGFGSIGKRHIRNLKVVDPSLDIAVLRQRSRDTDLGEFTKLVSKVFLRMEDALAWKPRVAVIANPAPLHMAAAQKFAAAGAHLFIEKPLSIELAQIDRLANICRTTKVIAAVGYVLRFSKPLLCLKQAIGKGRIGRILNVQARVGRFLPDWRPGTDYTAAVSSRRELGGGVIWELSHELDYLRWLAGEVREVTAYAENCGDFNIDVEDTAEMQLRLSGRILAHVHMDMLDRAATRGCRIIGTDATLTWDSTGNEHQVRLFKNGTWRTLFKARNLDISAMHRAQWKHFLGCLHHRRAPLVSLADGRRIVEVVLAAKRSAKTRKGVKL